MPDLSHLGGLSVARRKPSISAPVFGIDAQGGRTAPGSADMFTYMSYRSRSLHVTSPMASGSVPISVRMWRK